MAHNENEWRRSKSDSQYNRNFDQNRNREESDFYDRPDNMNRRSNDNYPGSSDRNYGQGFSGDRYNRENDNRWNQGDEYGSNRARYGNSTGVSRSGDYGDRGDNRQSDRQYSGSDYGSSPYNNQRNTGGGNNRDWWDKTTDEVSSWFGDEDAARRRKMDEVRGQHKGKGPKGYTRSDDRIKEDINDRLSDDDNVDASDIDVEVSNGEVTLTGTVDDRWAKRRAEDVAEAVSGVKNVENRLKVTARSGQQGSESNRSSGSNYNQGSTENSGSFGVPYGSSGAAPVGAFDTSKPE